MSSSARYFPDLVEKAVKPYPTVGADAQISSDQVERLKSEQLGSTGGTESPTSGNINSAVESSDEVLMARIGDGDKEGLACLFHRYARLVRAVGYKILKDDSEAD